MLPTLLIVIAVGYLLGSLPFGYWVARSRGVNIFEVGSRNPGATNVRRVLGSSAGNLVFALDAAKGALAAALPRLYFAARHLKVETLTANQDGDAAATLDWRTALAVAGLIAALLGHSFSCFTRFRGGKGVATSVGGMLVLMPLAALIAAASWYAVFQLSRYVSLASICGALALVLAAWLLGLSPLLLGVACVVAGFVILRHRSNIVRLLNGTENKFVKKTSSSQP